MMSNNPNWCEPESELTGIVECNAASLTGIEPVSVIDLGNTDVWLWRYAKIPAVVYRPAPRNMV